MMTIAQTTKEETMKTPTTPENLAKINAMFIALAGQMGHLAARWSDEKEYEDINDYQKVITLPAGFTLLKMTKRPFGFHFSIGTDAVYHNYVTGQKSTWKRIK
jgi:hypothetical protein